MTPNGLTDPASHAQRWVRNGPHGTRGQPDSTVFLAGTPQRPRGPPAAWRPLPSALSGRASGVTAPFVARCGSTGPGFVLKGNVSGGGGKRNKLSPLVSPGA